MGQPIDESQLLRLNLDTVALTLTQLSKIEQVFAGLVGEVGGAVTESDLFERLRLSPCPDDSHLDIGVRTARVPMLAHDLRLREPGFPELG